MQIFLANAKIMYDRAEKAALSTPLFQSVANELAAEMAMMDIDELARQLVAAENWRPRLETLSELPLCKHHACHPCL